MPLVKLNNMCKKMHVCMCIHTARRSNQMTEWSRQQSSIKSEKDVCGKSQMPHMGTRKRHPYPKNSKPGAPPRRRAWCAHHYNTDVKSKSNGGKHTFVSQARKRHKRNWQHPHMIEMTFAMRCLRPCERASLRAGLAFFFYKHCKENWRYVAAKITDH